MLQLTELDSQYFTSNAEATLQDLFEYESDEYNLGSDLISEVQRFYPDGDVSFLDVVRLVDSLSVYHPDMTSTQMKNVTEQLWNSVQ